ncbi:hypothetical protein RMN57_13175 [Kitasatospora sp. CM 4170]|uniref:Uncharacterized protein n=1 Tax=Kitasatospora aburaviensis TaxID=67265 RepID=A0ABW1F3F2_9ACTN|nr:hypothetical protein [Kitasatospora sp. CM 4170]WNM45606.1 hypothetical protein RMN57_13175 [Kitasatospora sp. CM 4170]
MAYSNGTAQPQQPEPLPEPQVVERGAGRSYVWTQPDPQPTPSQ